MSLLAVITAFPLLNNDSMYPFPGSTPPKTSITKSIESSFNISSKLLVKISSSISLSFDLSLTKTFFISIFNILLSSSFKRANTAEPMLPAPSTAIQNVLLCIFSKDKCYLY